ncbi:hypothetical protein MAR_037643 [Mya arenaria]|uniref:C2H2-type domain-containing protein n=1 Tax=Mya arenaria TaxID=6604 RepID=A0ABY7FSY5_MYAAR|nr:hypothetical protein MAR_037643 [Mya arenaria]
MDIKIEPPDSELELTDFNTSSCKTSDTTLSSSCPAYNENAFAEEDDETIPIVQKSLQIKEEVTEALLSEVSDFNANLISKDELGAANKEKKPGKKRKPRTSLTLEQRRICQVCSKVFNNPSNRLAHEKNR